MRQIIALASKDLRLLLRDKPGLFFTFVFPLLYCMLFGTIMSGMGKEPKGIKIVVVDEDRTDGSRDFVSTLQSAPELNVMTTDRKSATDLVRRGKRSAFVALMPGFGQARQRFFWGEPPEIETGIDPSRSAEAGMLIGILTKYLVEEMATSFADSDFMRSHIRDSLSAIRNADDMNPAWKTSLQLFLPALDQFMAELPDSEEAGNEGFGGFTPASFTSVDVTRQRKMPNAWAIAFPQGVIWGIIGCTASFTISLVIERTRGTLVRLRTAPIPRWQILAGKAAACFAATLALEVLIFSVGILGFGVRPGSFPLLVLACLSVSICFVGIMMLLSVLGKTEQSAGGIGWAVMILLAMIGGGMIPLLLLPNWLQTASHISPIKWSILAMEGAVWRGFSLIEMITPCAVLIAIGVACFALGTRTFRWTEQS